MDGVLVGDGFGDGEESGEGEERDLEDVNEGEMVRERVRKMRRKKGSREEVAIVDEGKNGKIVVGFYVKWKSEKCIE